MAKSKMFIIFNLTSVFLLFKTIFFVLAFFHGSLSPYVTTVLNLMLLGVMEFEINLS